MSKYITVIVVKNGRGQSGYRVKPYGGVEVRTDSNGKAVVEASGSEVSIYVDGRTAWEGATSRCPNPLIVER